MRTLVALLTTALLALGAPAPAGARGVPQQETTTTATASVSGTTVTLTIAVTAPAAPVPEGTVEVTEGETSLGTLPLADGTATWTGTATQGTHAYDVSYAPTDGRWLSSAAEPVMLTVGPPPHYIRCDPPYSVSLRLLPAERDARSTVVVRLMTRGTAQRYTGWMRLDVAAPGAFRKTVRLNFRDARRFVVSGPSMRRAGLYRFRAEVHPDGCPVRSGSLKVRVKKKRR